MAIPRPLILFWFALAALCAVLLYRDERQRRAQFLPVPENPVEIHIDTSPAPFTWQRMEKGWLMNGKPADSERIDDWLQLLRSCHGAYAPEDIPPVDDPHPVIITIDGARYHLGAENPFAQAHFMTFDRKIYLCGRALKAALRLSSERWLEPPDA